MYYNSFNNYLKENFGGKVRKIGLNAGFDCPHDNNAQRCIFCNEKGFSRYSETRKSLKTQIEESMKRVRERSKVNKFIAYFQNSTGTNASVEELKKAFDAILPYKDIVALSVSTRPDCISEDKLDLIETYSGNREVWLEYGIQTSWDKSLEWMNRGHTYADSVDAIERTARRDINIGVHLILGLPEERFEDRKRTARRISRLPVKGLKFHVLHVLKKTTLEKLYQNNDLKLFEKDDYVRSVCDFLEEASPDQIVLRLVSSARGDCLIAPEWMNRKAEVIQDIDREFEKRGTRQGSSFTGSN